MNEFGNLGLSVERPNRIRAIGFIDVSILGHMVAIPVSKVKRLEVGHMNEKDGNFFQKRYVFDKRVHDGQNGLFLDIFNSDKKLSKTLCISEIPLFCDLADENVTSLPDAVMDKNINGVPYEYSADFLLYLSAYLNNGQEVTISRSPEDRIVYLNRNGNFNQHCNYRLNLLDRGEKYDTFRSTWTTLIKDGFYYDNGSITDQKDAKVIRSVLGCINKKEGTHKLNSDIMGYYPSKLSEDGYAPVFQSVEEDEDRRIVVYALKPSEDASNRICVMTKYHKYNGKFYISKVNIVKQIETPDDIDETLGAKVIVLQYLYGKGHQLEQIRKYTKFSDNICADIYSSKEFRYSKPVVIFERRLKAEIGFISFDNCNLKDYTSTIYGQTVYARKNYKYLEVSCSIDKPIAVSIDDRFLDCTLDLKWKVEHVTNPSSKPCIPEITVNIGKILPKDYPKNSARYNSDTIGLEDLIIEFYEKAFNVTSSRESNANFSKGEFYVTFKFGISNDFCKYKYDMYLGRQMKSLECIIEEAAIRNVKFDYEGEEGGSTTSIYVNFEKSIFNYFARNNTETGFSNLLSAKIGDIAETKLSIRHMVDEMVQKKYFDN